MGWSQQNANEFPDVYTTIIIIVIIMCLYMEGNLIWNAHVTKLSTKLCSFVFVFLQMGETANATTSMETIFYRNGSTTN